MPRDALPGGACESIEIVLSTCQIGEKVANFRSLVLVIKNCSRDVFLFVHDEQHQELAKKLFMYATKFAERCS